MKHPSSQGVRRDACIHRLAPVKTNTFSNSLTCRIIRVISNSLAPISYLQVHLLTMAAIITTMTTMRMIHICINRTEKKRKLYPSTKPLTVPRIKTLGKKSTREHATEEVLVILPHLEISCGGTRASLVYFPSLQKI